MSWIQDITDVGGKLAQRFLTLDDLVAGQGVVGGSLAQVANAGRLGAGSVLVSSNLAARAVQLGVQAGAKTARVTAQAVEGLVPGAAAARALADKLDAQATAAAEEASLVAAHGVELVGGPGTTPKNPITKAPWLGKEMPHGYTWTELTADTVVGSFGRIAALPFVLSADSASAVTSTGVGRMAWDATVKAVHGAIDLTSRSTVSKKTKLDEAEVREALLALANSTGLGLVRDFVAIAQAATRFTLGDPRRLVRGMREGLEEMRLLAEHPEMNELFPALPISETLRSRAREIVDHPPAHFLAAIAKRPPRWSEVVKALIEDANALRVFLVNYPQVVTLLGANTVSLLAAGLFDAADVEDYVRKDEKKGKPWSVTGFEDYVGLAVVGEADSDKGYYPESAVYLAQDVSFLYSSEVLGRDKALARAERIFGREVRDRVGRDVSLELGVLKTEKGEAREERIRRSIAEIESSEELTRWRDTGQEQLDSLEAFAGVRLQYVPPQVTERIEVLRFFLSVTNQQLALGRTEPEPEDAGRVAAREAFDAWVDSGGGSSPARGAKKPAPVAQPEAKKSAKDAKSES